MDKKRLLKDLINNYTITHEKSGVFFKQASRFQVQGGSHNLRLFAPYPFYDIQAHGSKITDMDGHTYVDFWQGHFSNILGHNPKFVLRALRDYFRKGQGLTTGFPGTFQKDLAELILKSIGADKIRFTTSGTLATMYAVMLALAYTHRDMWLKVGGGWHGAHPYLLKGISAYEKGFRQMESAGFPSGLKAKISITRFNDIEDLEDTFRKHGERLACFILEPFIGAGGFIFASKGYLRKARELTRKYNVLLILDEVVSGFRFHAGGLQSLYGIRPDLTVLGKAIGGGMPVSAVAGKAEIMDLCSPERGDGRKVKFEGGTFSAHPASMLAGLTLLRYLREHEVQIYRKIGCLGEQVRKGIEDIFFSYGFPVKCSGYGQGITKNSSLVGVHFLRKKIERISSPDEVWNPGLCDIDLREKYFKLAMLEEGFNIFHGFGAISAAHSEAEIQASLNAVERIARKWKKYM